MKHYIFLVVFLVSTLSFSQSSEKDTVKAAIERFFEGFHKQDTLIMLEAVSKDIKMQSIGKNREGVTQLNTTEFQGFLNSIISIPKDKPFREEILDYTIQIDGDMAHVWTPYNFWFDNNFSHCGVNSFQLFKEKGNWKIIYLIDTRRRDCMQE
ncbi:Putative lumazine-binding [Formosa sp. Hel1_31_208]|uniref:nuclear transport factor 2 family protein n=1 Tax=Formosa sp. Hel1_31_208 TaxID=1798225 RepID=UPI00087CE68E|nr:nuclear transport factor 2 family protein [Formosa sp. Hel1_31_208]SDS49015.1 Putative lumazine-binding [Formosa sp. Hel1_31_208]